MPLPDSQSLNRLYDELNRRWWNGQLPKVPVRWSQRMHAKAGKYWRSKRRGWEIVLSVPYHRHYPSDVEDTLLHEMVHVWQCENDFRRLGVMHDLVFRREAKRVGTSLHCRSYAGMQRPRKYLYRCPNCGKTAKYRKRVSLACRSCCVRFNKGKYDEKFELQLADILKERG